MAGLFFSHYRRTKWNVIFLYTDRAACSTDTIERRADTSSNCAQAICFCAGASSGSADTISSCADTISLRAETISSRAQAISLRAETISFRAQTISLRADAISSCAQAILLRAEVSSTCADTICFRADASSVPKSNLTGCKSSVNCRNQQVHSPGLRAPAAGFPLTDFPAGSAY